MSANNLQINSVYNLFFIFQVSIGVPSKPSMFTFMPVVRKLPIEAIVTEEKRSGALTGRAHKVQQQQQQYTSRRLKSDFIANWCLLSVILSLFLLQSIYQNAR